MDLIQSPSFLQQIADARIIRVKKNYHRVYLTPANEVIKVFFMKDSFKKTQKRVEVFLHNIERLKQLNINTIRIIKTEAYPENNAIAVYYHYIPGKTVSQCFIQTKNRAWLSSIFDFIFKLQNQGIYFQDLHPDNIIIDEKGEPHLIDVQSLKFYSISIPFWACCRNIVTFFSNSSTQHVFSIFLINNVLDYFLNKFHLRENKKLKCKRSILFLINLRKEAQNAYKAFWRPFYIYRVILRNRIQLRIKSNENCKDIS